MISQLFTDYGKKEGKIKYFDLILIPQWLVLCKMIKHVNNIIENYPEISIYLSIYISQNQTFLFETYNQVVSLLGRYRSNSWRG